MNITELLVHTGAGASITVQAGWDITRLGRRYAISVIRNGSRVRVSVTGPQVWGRSYPASIIEDALARDINAAIDGMA